MKFNDIQRTKEYVTIRDLAKIESIQNLLYDIAPEKSVEAHGAFTVADYDFMMERFIKIKGRLISALEAMKNGKNGKE